MHRFCDVVFVIFTILWFVTRIVIYPLKYVTLSQTCPQFRDVNNLQIIKKNSTVVSSIEFFEKLKLLIVLVNDYSTYK